MRLNEIFVGLAEGDDIGGYDRAGGKYQRGYLPRIDKAIDFMFASPQVGELTDQELRLLAVAVLDQAGVDARTQQKLKQMLGAQGKAAG